MMATLLLQGCASVPRLNPPDITLVDLDFVDATLFESTFRATIRVTNDNFDPLLLEGAVIELELEGRRFGRGTYAERVELPRLDSVVLPIDVNLSHVAIASKIERVVDEKSVSYAISGTIEVVTTSGASRRLPVSKRGVIDLGGRVEPTPDAGATTQEER